MTTLTPLLINKKLALTGVNYKKGLILKIQMEHLI